MRLTKRSPKKPEKSRFPSRKGDGPGRKFHSPTGNAPPTTGSRGATGTETGRSDPKGGTAPGRSGQNGCGALLREPRPTARPEAPRTVRRPRGNRTADDRIAGRTPQTDRQDNRPDNLPKCGCAETTGGTSPSRETSRPSLSGCRRNYFSVPAFFGSAFTLSEAKPSTIFASSFFDAS